MRVAVVHDWLYVVGGAERVLHQILQCYPKADVFAVFDILTPADRAKIGFERSTTSFVQKMPFIRTRHRSYLPLMPLAVEQFDLSGYDLVISSSSAVAKGVITGPDQVHVAYVHSPMRYAWDMQHAYLKEGGYDRGIKGAIARYILHRMRIWDARTAHGPDAIVANSAFVARRIQKIYGRTASIIHPPVTLSNEVEVERGDHFITASRLVPYKNMEAVVRAFRDLPDQKLIVAGDGPEAPRLKKLATDNVTFAGFVSDPELRHLMASARAFIFAAEEDFGIVPLEAQSEGTPVLALGRGGSRETVSTAIAQRTGMFFDTPDPDDIVACVRSFIAQEHMFSRSACRTWARRFSAARFRAEFTALVDEEMEANRRARDAGAPHLVPPARIASGSGMEWRHESPRNY